MQSILSVVTFLPLVGALLVYIVRGDDEALLMSMMNRTGSTIIALLLGGAAPALAQSAPPKPEHVPLQKTIGQARPDIVPSLIGHT